MWLFIIRSLLFQATLVVQYLRRYLVVFCCFALSVSGLSISAFAAAQVPATEKDPGITVTTSSPEARELFAAGLARCQTLHLREGFQLWRKAAQVDPDFALVHILLSNFSPDPAERVAERDKALASRSHVSAEEQLVIDWLSNSSQGHFVPAIQAMNTALDQYKDHKMLVWLAGMWLDEQHQWTRAAQMYEQALKLDPTFADAWNSLAYCYASSGDFDKASAAMQRYMQLLPDQANPHDTYGDILLLAGKFDEAMEQYRTALKLDPGFVESERGIADTLALMGEESRARQEYADAIAKVNDKVEALRWSLLAAITYVRESDFTAADKAFQNVAKQAHQNGLGIVEAEAYRGMALYQRQSAAAKTSLIEAEAALRHQHQTPQSLRDQELASIMRTQVERALRDGDRKLAVNSLKALEALSSGTIDGSIHLYYEAAAGALALARKNYSAAISHLSDNDADPLSLLHLMEAYKQLGRSAEAQSVATRLAALNLPTIDQAVIVPAFRKTQLAAPKSSVNTGNR
jgi:tetratricopeptide (TPR) repeat protein